MAKTNKQILDEMSDLGTQEFAHMMDRAQSEEISGVIADYPSFKNEFINTLTNKVVRTEFYSKVFSNPLSMLKKGALPHGFSLEQLFVEMAEVKGFFDNFTGSESVEGDLIRSAQAKVLARYISQNFQYKSKASLSDMRLKQAFLTTNGLSLLSGQLSSSTSNAINLQEYKDMKALLEAVVSYKQLVQTVGGKGVTSTKHLTTEIAPQTMAILDLGKTTSLDEKAKMRLFSEKVRAMVGQWKFPSTKYNMAKVNTWSNPEDLVLVTTPELIAKMDVQSLADAFNVSKADLEVRTILVDSLPEGSTLAKSTDGSTYTSGTIYGYLFDKDFLQIYDTLVTSGSFYNADQLVTNLFMHHHGIMANCFFANACVIASDLQGGE